MVSRTQSIHLASQLKSGRDKPSTSPGSAQASTVPFYLHSLGAADADRIARVLASPILTSGDVGREVEAQIAAFFGTANAALTNSWTNGAIATLLAIGIAPGDEVIVPAQTFIATANAAEVLGAKVVFVDVDPDTLLSRSDDIIRAVTPNTRVVIPVHLYGQMVDVAGLKAALAPWPRIAIIEDCAHAFEASFDGHWPGRFSDAAVFSFYATKNVTCGEGGAITTNNPELHERILQTRMHGMSAAAVDRHRASGYRHWDMVRMGVKANLPDLLAALLSPQIASIRERLSIREALAAR